MTDAQQAELDRRDELNETIARFDVPRGYCPYCTHDRRIPGNGWYRMCLDGEYPDTPDESLGDRYVNAWQGWFSPCDHCNPDHLLPEGVT